MTTAAGNSVSAAGDSSGCVSDALRAGIAALDYVHAASAMADGSVCGDLLITLSEMQAKLTAAHAGLLRRFDAADAHDADGYGSSSAWLAARGGMSRKGARAAVRQMRQLGARPLLGDALAAGDITDSLAFTIADWTRKLPAEMRTETDRILLRAATSGASLDDLQVIAGAAIEKWRQQQPAPGDPDDNFEDRSLTLGVTFGGAAVLRGNLSPVCAAVRAVLEALGKRTGSDDNRTEDKRFHDALQLACQLLLRPAWSPTAPVATPPPSSTYPCPSSATCPGPRAWRTSGSVPTRAFLSTSATPAPSRARSAAPSTSATVTVPGLAATGLRPTATCITCGTRPTAARPQSRTALRCAASITTCASTGAGGR